MWAVLLAAALVARTDVARGLPDVSRGFQPSDRGPERAAPQQTTAPQAVETVTAIQIQGNTATPDEDVRRLADVRVGMPFDAGTIDAVAGRLRAAKRFERVDVRKRFASIEDPSQIALVIVVDEGPVKVVMTGDPDHPTRVARKTMPNVLILPILRWEDGYGMTYGARFTLPEPRWMGKHSRIMFPMSWGGLKQAGVELEKRIEGGVIDRVTTGASVSRRTDPAFDLPDDRARLFVRGEHEFSRVLRAGATTGWQRASFQGVDDRFTQLEGDVVLDTRADPVLARNAVYGRAAWEHMSFGDGPADPGQSRGGATRTTFDGRGYLGLVKQLVLAGRILREDSDRPLPIYMKPELGGLTTLRGFPAGYLVGDTLVAMSAELVLPLTSPLKVGKLGVTGFIDRGTAYNKGEQFSDQTLLEGYGGSVWFAAAFLRLNVAIAHGVGAGTRVHVGGNVTF